MNRNEQPRSTSDRYPALHGNHPEHGDRMRATAAVAWATASAGTGKYIYGVQMIMVNYRNEILKTLAWLAPLRTDQLQRIVAPHMPKTNFRNRFLNPMAQDGSIMCVDFFYDGGYGHTDVAKRRPPKPIGKVWAISERGFAVVARSDESPLIPAKVRKEVLEHDLMTSEVITKVIEWTRPILSSIYLDHEVRLDETRRRPIADAMLVVRYANAPERNDRTVPWKSLPPKPGEGIRLYAIEMDRDTEVSSIIHEKATNYLRVRSDPTFYQRYGNLYPTVLIVVPSTRRLNDWHQGWVKNWPMGTWQITTDADLQRDQWLYYDQGRERLRTFVDGWQPGHDVPKGLETKETANTSTTTSKLPPISLPKIDLNNLPKRR